MLILSIVSIVQVAEAVCLEQLSYHEAWELSYFGANVLHPRTTLPAMKFRRAEPSWLVPTKHAHAVAPTACTEHC